MWAADGNRRVRPLALTETIRVEMLWSQPDKRAARLAQLMVDQGRMKTESRGQRRRMSKSCDPTAAAKGIGRYLRQTPWEIGRAHV